MPFADFVLEHLPPAPARVLEVGSGLGELATRLTVGGYEVLGIDPAAPPGGPFRRLKLDDLDPADGPFAAVVAARTLHALRDVDAAVGRMAELLEPAGVAVVEEPAWDRMDDATLDWLWGQVRALAAARGGEAPATAGALREEWEAAHLGLHGHDTLLIALARRFERTALAWAPGLHVEYGGVAAEVLEQALVDAGAIQPLAFRFAGRLRPDA